MRADHSTSASAARIVGRPFPKGISGNPGGLPRGVAGRIMRARRLALKFAPKAIATLAALLSDGDPRVRVAAAEGLLDRAGLRPYSLEPERHEVAVAAIDVDALRATLAARVAALAVIDASAAPVMLPPAGGAAAGTGVGVGYVEESASAPDVLLSERPDTPRSSAR